jgi:hypothetical protein
MTQLEKNLLDWENEDRDIFDDLFTYFEKEFGRHDCWDIADEGRRLWNLMFDECIEQQSVKDGLFKAITAHAEDCAFANVADVLGVDVNDLQCAVEEWHTKDHLQFPVGPDELMRLCFKNATERQQYETRG